MPTICTQKLQCRVLQEILSECEGEAEIEGEGESEGEVRVKMKEKGRDYVNAVTLVLLSTHFERLSALPYAVYLVKP